VTVTDLPHLDVLPFRLETLTTAGNRTLPLAVNDDGHLVVDGRTAWRPLRFSRDLRAIVCARVDSTDNDREGA
jgi:hypothetical protein